MLQDGSVLTRETVSHSQYSQRDGKMSQWKPSSQAFQNTEVGLTGQMGAGKAVLTSAGFAPVPGSAGEAAAERSAVFVYLGLWRVLC